MGRDQYSNQLIKRLNKKCEKILKEFKDFNPQKAKKMVSKL
jgi:hypothetical protein